MKGRGATHNPNNKFEQHHTESDPEYLEYAHKEGEEPSNLTKTIAVNPKTIVNKVTSPDVGMDWSMNPYQGCEHGCVYCYARNSHEYWGYSAGTDFEQIILYKENAAELLRCHLMKRSWEGEPIILSGNTDCYQPIERKLKITRSLLEVMWEFRNPVGIITKNSLVRRDIDLLEKMARLQTASVTMSITTLDEELRRRLEPRTASVVKKLKTIRTLSDAGIPVSVMMAPIIPGLNDHEIMEMAEKVKDAGALDISYTTVRLNGQIAGLFKNWIDREYPDRANKILGIIEELHGGKLNDSAFGRRMKGEGTWANHIRSIFQLAKQKFNMGNAVPELSSKHFKSTRNQQLSLF